MKKWFFRYWWGLPAILGWLSGIVCLCFDRTVAPWLLGAGVVVSIILFLLNCVPRRRDPKKLGIVDFP